MLSIIMPLAPPVDAKASVNNAPALIQVTVLSVVVTPGVAGHMGGPEPDVPVTVLVAISTLPLLSRIRARKG